LEAGVTQDPSIDADLLILGGGMAGMTAGGYAASRGARVVVLEKGPEIGGSAVLSGTSLWTVATLEALRERAPDGDLELGRHLVEHYREALDWVRSTGVPMAPPRLVLGYGRGFRFDILDYLRRCEALVKAAGGHVLRNMTAERLLTRDGAVVGAKVRGPDGPGAVDAPATLIATGGWQGDRGLLRDVFGKNGDLILHRANPHSTGEGQALARAIGARMTGDMRTFYGHLMMSPIANFAREHYTRMGVWYSQESLLLNTKGERFTDESLGDHHSAQAAALQPQAKALLVLDEFIAVNFQMSGNTIPTSLAEARREGVRIADTQTLEELGDAVTPWGFDGARVVRSVRQYNDHLFGRVDTLPVPRRWSRHPLMDPPFHALEVRAAITFTEGGLHVDTSARVLDKDARAIPGLLAAGADIGGIYNGGYAGGLALACVYGMTAARTALAVRPAQATVR
jgi:succinate dehydrogenase/fumarate reductase flavoprotein subunit